MKIGYARVSTPDQQASLHTQTETLREIGCERVYTDIASGTKSKRPGLGQALTALRPDDILIVTRLDRLGRTTLDTLKTFQRLDESGIRIKALDLDIDTAAPAGRLVATTIISLAQWEVDLLRERTREGLESARQRGAKLGRPPKISVTDQKKILRLLAEGTFSSQELATHYGVHRSTIERIKAKYRDEE